jgi:hypothetical protein
VADYEFAIVTFLDILGFRDLVSDADANAVNSKLEAVERFTRPSSPPPSDDAEETYEPLVLQFSDAIVRVRRVRTKWNIEHPIGLLFHELLDLVHAQGDLIGEGVLLRGGISCGSIYASQDRVFGPALVAAYELESKFALYPRIVVDPTLLAEFRKNVLLKARDHDLGEEEQHVRQLLRRGDDGMWFVDYLRAVESELDDIDMYPHFLRAHRQLVLSGAKRFSGLTGAISKYLWLASYHNERISALPATWLKHYRIKRNDLLISTEELGVLQELPPNSPLR